MELGKGKLEQLFARVDVNNVKQKDAGKWKAYRNEERIFSDDLVIGPNSIDVTLAGTILVPALKKGHDFIDLENSDCLTWGEADIVEGGPHLLMPGMFVLGSTAERFESGAAVNITNSNSDENIFFKQDISGRSTCGRVGLCCHATAAYGDYGFQGQWTLEIYNVSPFPIKLTPGMRIAQVFFSAVYRPGVYSGSYVAQIHGAKAPVLGKGRV